MDIMPDEDKKTSDENKSSNSVWEFIKVVAISLLIVIPIRTYVAQPFIVEGSSMEPNYHNGEYLIIDELSYAFRAPERGEVVVFRYPLMPSEFFIKRLIGLPGETIEIRNNKIFVNNEPIDELYLPNNFQTGPDNIVKLSGNQYFVMGDNRAASSDSRIWGTLPRKNITGKVLLRLWPLTRIGIVNEPEISYKL